MRLVVHAGADGHRFLDEIDAREVPGKVEDLAKLRADQVLAEVA